MTKHVASPTKKFLAAGGLAFALASLSMFASVGTAAADGLDASSPAVIDANGTQETPDTGSYDEMLSLAQEKCWQSRMSAGCDHSRITSTYPAGNWSGSWPGGNARP
jgi:hypothetical protein